MFLTAKILVFAGGTGVGTSISIVMTNAVLDSEIVVGSIVGSIGVWLIIVGIGVGALVGPTVGLRVGVL